MVAILQRLEAHGVGFPQPCDADNKVWAFKQELVKKDINFFRYVVAHHLAFNVEYSVHCAQLAHDLLKKNTHELLEQIKTALMMAELMEIIYRDYLNISREVIRLRKEQDVYRSLLVDHGYHFRTEKQTEVIDTQRTKDIRENTAVFNFSRMLITRLRRFLVLVAPVASDAGYTNGINLADFHVNPILNYASWLFFIPRLSTNLFLTAKHLFPGDWMSEQEKALGWRVRLQAQMQRRWFEIGNDLVTMSVNVINCFVLIGALSPIGLYATAAVLLFDVGYACLRVAIELGRLKKLEKKYIDMLSSGEVAIADRQKTKDYLVHLQQRIAYEQKRVYIHLALTVTLLLAFAITFPFFAICPVIPLIGALIAVIATIGFFVANKKVEQEKPADKISPKLATAAVLRSHGIFKSSTEPDLDRRSNPETAATEDMPLPQMTNA